MPGLTRAMPDAIAVGPVLLSTTVLLLAAAVALAIWLSGRLAARLRLDAGAARRLAEGSAVAGVLGARAGFVLLLWEAYAHAPWTALYLWQPGYLPAAGLVLALVYALWHLRSRIAANRLRYARAVASAFAFSATLLLACVVALHRLADAGTVDPGEAVPDFVLEDIDGGRVGSADLRGRPVVLNFWATWCAPCRREMPLLEAAHRTHGPGGLAIVGVAVDESAETVRQFADSTGVTYPLWVDASGAREDVDRTAEVHARLGGVGFPMTLFVGRDGVVRNRHTGELSGAYLEREIDGILAQ